MKKKKKKKASSPQDRWILIYGNRSPVRVDANSVLEGGNLEEVGELAVMLFCFFISFYYTPYVLYPPRNIEPWVVGCDF